MVILNKQKQAKLEAKILELENKVKALEGTCQDLLEAYETEPIKDILPHIHKISALLGHRQLSETKSNS